MEQKLIAFTCPNCGAPFDGRAGPCDYCCSWVERYRGPEIPESQLQITDYDSYLLHSSTAFALIGGAYNGA